MDEMPFKDRDFDVPTEVISNNVNKQLGNWKSLTDFKILICGGAPGIGIFGFFPLLKIIPYRLFIISEILYIGKTRFGRELFNHPQKS